MKILRLLLLSIVLCAPVLSHAADEQQSEQTLTEPKHVEVPGHFDMHSCAPTYPTMALHAKEQGTVKIRFEVNADGKLVSTTVTKTSGFNDLDRAAVNALSRCVYTPKLVDGKPTESTFNVTYVWQLPNS